MRILLNFTVFYFPRCNSQSHNLLCNAVIHALQYLDIFMGEKYNILRKVPQTKLTISLRVQIYFTEKQKKNLTVTEHIK